MFNYYTLPRSEQIIKPIERQANLPLQIEKDVLFTSFPVGTCLASLTLAKFPLPIVLIRRYLPMWTSSAFEVEERLRLVLELDDVELWPSGT